MKTSELTHARISKTLLKEIRFKFPNLPVHYALQIAYDTSLLKLEGKLRDEDYISSLRKKINKNDKI